MNRVVLVFVLGCASGGPQHAAGPTLAAAIETANRTNQPLVVEFGAVWCKPCHVFADRVLTDPRVATALHAITFVQYDIDTPAGAEAMRRCDVTGVPAIVSLDRAGGIRATKSGAAPTADEFLAFLHAAHEP